MDFYRELFETLSEERVIEYLELDAKGSGGVFKGTCPAGHDSASGGSFQISEKKFHCWNCGIGGNLIHLIEFVKFGTITKKTTSDNYKQARDIACDIAGLNRLFNLSLSPEEAKRIEQEQIEKQTVYDILSRATILSNKHLLGMFQGERCEDIDLLRTEIEQFKIGFMYPGLLKDLKKEYEFDDIKKTGLIVQDKESWVLSLADRYSFPFIQNGQTVYFSGRVAMGTQSKIKYKKLPLHSDKHKHISPCISNTCFYNEDVIKTAKEIIITEGLTDCIAAVGKGFSAVSSTSVNTKEEVFQRIIAITKNIYNIYICYDVEDSNAGGKSAIKVAELFLKNKKELKIIHLPKPDGKSKIDLKDYFKDHIAEDFDKIMKSSQTLIHKAIEQIPETTDKFSLANLVEPILDLLSYCDPITTNSYLNYMLKTRFNLKGTEVTLFMNRIKSIAKLRDAKIEQSKNEITDLTNIIEVNQGMDFVNGVLYYTMFVKYVEECVDEESGLNRKRIIKKPYMISSKKEFIKYEDWVERGIALPKEIVENIDTPNQWSTMDGVPYSIPEFLSGAREVDPADLYLRIKQYFDEYVVFPENFIASHMSIVIMASYLVMLFDSVGYVHLHAEKRSGKTRVLEIIEGLGYNSLLSSSISDSSLFRMIEATRCLLLTDEAENLGDQYGLPQLGEKMQLLNGGYKKSGGAIRSESINDKPTPVKFSTYSIKVFAGIKEINSTLRDRTITHVLKRVYNKPIKNFLPTSFKHEWEVIRNKLHCFAMAACNDIHNIYSHELILNYGDVLAKRGITSREYEIWSPYLSIALYLDRIGKGRLNLFAELLDIASFSINYKSVMENESFTNRLMTIIGDFVFENKSIDAEDQDIYNLSDLVKEMKTHEGFENITAHALAKMMYGKLFLAKKENTFRRRRHGENIKDTFVKITEQDLKEAMGRCGITSL